ncbi:hypothetical protein LCGC14_0956490, partial [marine sediment metagenome]
MTVYKNDDVLFGRIEYRRQGIPEGEFFLKDSIDVSPDDEIKIIGNYTSTSTTRTIISGSDGAPAVGTDNFFSTGSTFTGGNVVVGDMLIIEDGDDKGSYIVSGIDGATQLSLDDHDGNAVSFSGDTSNVFRVGLIVFGGLIDIADFEPNQKIEVISRGQELIQERPSGSYGGYTEVVWGEMIKDASFDNITINYTENTLIIEPTADDSKIAWDDPNGNNNNIMYDDVIEYPGAADNSYIETSDDIGEPNEIIFDLSNHSLSGDYHYIPYKVDILATVKRGAIGGSGLVDFYDGVSWQGEQTIILTTSWVEKTTTFNLSSLSEDDIDNFQVKFESQGHIGSFRIDRVYIIVYYRYYDDFSDPGSTIISLDAVGELTLADYGNKFALTEQQTWYLDPGLTIYMNDSDKDTGSNFANSDQIKNVTGTQNIKSYTRVFLKGGYPEGLIQITAETGSGFPLWKDTYSLYVIQAELNVVAAALLVEQSANQYIIQLERVLSSDGLYQVAETVTLPADIKFSGSDRLIPSGQYILNKVDYIINNGIYFSLDIEIIDGLIFSNPPSDKTTGSNASNLANEGLTQVGQIEGGGGGTLSNIVEDTSPQLGGALDTAGKSINDNTGDNIVDIDDDLNVQGNITLTGTVDGVDIATRDHTKYTDGNAVDAIEAVGLAAPISTDWLIFSDAGVLKKVAMSTLTPIIMTGLPKYTDALAVSAVASADVYLKLVGDTMAGGINMGTNEMNNASNYKLVAGHGYGLKFWNGQDIYSIYMSTQTNATYGGRADATSDYNMYFIMTGGTNRGFQFCDGLLNPYFAITPDTGIWSSVPLNMGGQQITNVGNVDGKNVSGLATVVEAHAYVEANALTLENALAMGANKITGLAAATANGDAVRWEQIHSASHSLDGHTGPVG